MTTFIETVTAMIVALFMSGQSIPADYSALKTLATTGSGDQLAAEGYGQSFHKDGGMVGAFTYMGKDMPYQVKAQALLKEGEFLAPHYFRGWDGKYRVMVAPHLFMDGMLMKGAGPDDNFIEIKDGIAKRYDYSEDVAGK